MGQVFPILLVLIVLVGEPYAQREPWPSAAVATLGLLAGVAAVVGGMAMTLFVTRRRLDRGDLLGGLRAAGRGLAVGRAGLLVVFALATFGLGWPAAVRGVTGDLILIDEAIVLAPPILGLVASWWLHYPVERRLREALLIRELDRGGPLRHVPSRASHVGQNIRVNLLLLLLPVLAIVALTELWTWAAGPSRPSWLDPIATLAAAATVFSLAPLGARLVLRLEPLPEGELREALLDVCRRHGIGVREIFVWRTHGAVINAAVMGIFRRVRYVLMTDALLETMPRAHVLAVMAHEIGHVHRRHLVWLVLTLLAALALAGTLITLPLLFLETMTTLTPSEASLPWIDGGLTVMTATLGLVAFGWASRRFERQADTFAAQHLSGLGSGGDVVTPEAIAVVTGALASVAALNGVDAERPSWRHGSIAWRIAYLRSLVGQPLDGLAIDRQVRRIQAVAAVGLVVAVAFGIWLESRPVLPPVPALADASPETVP